MTEQTVRAPLYILEPASDTSQPPPAPRAQGRPALYPFALLEVGEGFLILCDPNRNCNAGSLSYWHRRLPERRFERLKIDTAQERGFRIRRLR